MTKRQRLVVSVLGLGVVITFSVLGALLLSSRPESQQNVGIIQEDLPAVTRGPTDTTSVPIPVATVIVSTPTEPIAEVAFPAMPASLSEHASQAWRELPSEPIDLPWWNERYYYRVPLEIRAPTLEKAVFTNGSGPLVELIVPSEFLEIYPFTSEDQEFELRLVYWDVEVNSWRELPRHVEGWRGQNWEIIREDGAVVTPYPEEFSKQGAQSVVFALNDLPNTTESRYYLYMGFLGGYQYEVPAEQRVIDVGNPEWESGAGFYSFNEKSWDRFGNLWGGWECSLQALKGWYGYGNTTPSEVQKSCQEEWVTMPSGRMVLRLPQSFGRWFYNGGWEPGTEGTFSFWFKPALPIIDDQMIAGKVAPKDKSFVLDDLLLGYGTHGVWARIGDDTLRGAVDWEERWYAFSLVWDEQGSAIWLNGQMLASSTATFTLPPRSPATPSLGLGGIIEDVKPADTLMANIALRDHALSPGHLWAYDATLWHAKVTLGRVEKAQVTTVIAPEMGEMLLSPDQRTRLDFPPGSVEAVGTITYTTEYEDMEVLARFSITGTIQLVHPYTLTYFYDANIVEDGQRVGCLVWNEEEGSWLPVCCVVWNEEKKSWLPLPINLDKNADLFTVTLDRYGEYVIP